MYTLLNEEKLIAGLFEYIRSNKIIPAFFAAIKKNITLHNVNLALLKNAIAAGDENAAIFSEANCHLYLLYLINEKEIPFWQGITVYHFLITLAQFTELQKNIITESDSLNDRMQSSYDTFGIGFY